MSVVFGKEAEPGGEPATAPKSTKLKSLRESEVSDMGKLAGLMYLFPNGAGFFDTEAYSERVLSGLIMDSAKTMLADTWMLILRDAATAHHGHFRAKGADEET